MVPSFLLRFLVYSYKCLSFIYYPDEQNKKGKFGIVLYSNYVSQVYMADTGFETKKKTISAHALNTCYRYKI